MAKKHRFRIHTTTMESKSMPRESSNIAPIPYFPNLRRALASHGAALLLIYLELHAPASQDHPDRPVLINIRRVCLDLQLGTWNLWRYFSYVGTRYESTAARSAAQMSGREYLREDRRWGIGSIKCYSLTAAGHGTYSLRRNYLRLQSLLSATGAAAHLANWTAQQLHSQDEQTTGQKTAGSSESRDPHSFLRAQIDDAILRRPEVIAAAVARSLNKISGLGDGRRVAGLKRKEHKRRPWTEERRKRYEETMARKREIPKANGV